jgi:hypothetical protein
MFNTFFFFENLAFYEIMSKNVVEPERPQMTKWRRCISKATRVQAHAHIRIAYCFASTTTHHNVTFIHTLLRLLDLFANFQSLRVMT